MSLATATMPYPFQETMKIQHTTHEESRDGVPSISTRRLSTSMKVRTFISRRISQTFHSPPLSSHHEESNSSEDRPITQFPRPGQPKHSLSDGKVESPDLTGYFGKNNRTHKATRSEEKVDSSTESSRSNLPLKSPSGTSPTKSKGFSMPSLKKKNTFSDLVKEKLSRRSEASDESINSNIDPEKAAENKEKLAKAYNLRKAMLEGKLERVIPPPSTSISGGQNRRPPPRPPHHQPFPHSSLPGSISSPPPTPSKVGAVTGRDAIPTNTLKSTERESPSSRTSLSSTRPTSRARKTKSASSRIVSLIGNSADLMDETRREIQGRFKEPFEHLNYPSFSLARRVANGGGGGGGGAHYHADGEVGRQSDADSDESFFCMGDKEPGVLSLEVGRGSGREVVSQNGNGFGYEMSMEKFKKREREMEKEKEKERDFYNMPRPKTRGKGSERTGNRFSIYERGRGRDRDPPYPSEKVIRRCKLCGLGIASSARGLCAECEADLLPLAPQQPTHHTQITYSDSDYEDDDIPPTLPLKIRKQVPTREQSANYKLGPEAYKQRNPFAFEESDGQQSDTTEYPPPLTLPTPPPVPPKDDIFLGLSLPNKTYKPQVTRTNPSRQISQRARIETHEVKQPHPQPQQHSHPALGRGLGLELSSTPDPRSPRTPSFPKVNHRFSGWTSDNIDSPTYEEAQRILERWSDCFGGGGGGGGEEASTSETVAVAAAAVRGDGYGHGEGVMPLVRAMDCDGVKRDSEFYRFWDEVLREHAPRQGRV